MWGFPGGIIEPGETASYAVKRECEEELGLLPEKAMKFATVKTTFPDTSVTYFLGYRLKQTKGKGWEKIGKVKEVALKKMVKLATEGKINDPRLVVTILHLNKLCKQGKIYFL